MSSMDADNVLSLEMIHIVKSFNFIQYSVIQTHIS
jgi:hypothetical protein